MDGISVEEALSRMLADADLDARLGPVEPLAVEPLPGQDEAVEVVDVGV
jgi:hypothetical protein